MTKGSLHPSDPGIAPCSHDHRASRRFTFRGAGSLYREEGPHPPQGGWGPGARQWELFYSYQQLPTRFQLLQVTMR